MFTTRPELRGTFGVVASTHWIASAVGMSILERGGNAFDAAVATGFTLQVVEPHLNGPGGEVPMLLWSRKNRKVEALCGQGVTPAGATIAHYRALGPRPRARHRLPRRDRPRRLRRLAAAAARLRHDDARRCAGAGDLLRRERLSAGRPHSGGDRDGEGLLPRRVAELGGDLPARRQGAADRAAVPQPRHGGDIPARHRRGRGGGRRPRRADRGGAPRLVPRLRRRGDRPLLPDRGHGHVRPAPSRPSHRRRHGALAGHGRGAGDLRLHDYTVAKCGPWSQGPLLLQQLAAARRASTSPAMDPLGAASSTPSSNAPSSPSPTARRGTAIPISSTCR